jgi:O-antigen ligase
MAPKSSLTLALANSVLLLVALATPAVRGDLGRLRGLGWPAGFFAATVLVIVWSMTPYVPGGPHPVWAYVGEGPSAATMDKSQTLLQLIKLLGLGGAFMLGCALGVSDSRARAALEAMLALGAALGFWAFVTFAGGALGPGVSRLPGSFGNANTSATLFGMLLAIALGTGVSRARAAAGRGRFAETAPYWGAGLVFAACVLATASRGGFTATAAGLVAFALLHAFGGRGRWTRSTVGVPVGLVVVAVLLAVAGGQLVDRFSATAWELDGRRQIFHAHWQAFLDAPWMGYGLGAFDALNRVILDASNLEALWRVRAAHNVYLSWLEQAGVIGAAPMFLCIGAVILTTLRRTTHRTRFTAPLFGLLAADAVVLAHGVTDFALETYSMAAFWSLLLGLQFAASQGSRR